jgi:YfiH family protein
MKIFETQEAIAIFSDRNDGDLNFYAANKEEIEKNWRNLAQKIGLSSKLPFYVNQVHQSEIVQVASETSSPTSQIKADGLITDQHQIPIGVFTADCCPVLISNPKVVSATHAGWKSTLQNICSKTVSKYNDVFGITPDELTAFIGPCIGQCCFELGDEVYEMFISENPEWEQFFIKKGKWHLDLRALNRFQLEKAGIPQNKIIDLDECTYCLQDKYFSYRRMKKRNGSMFSFIFLK